MGEVVPQVMESEILDQWELVLCSLRLELAEPIVDAFFGQLRAALRDKHVGTCYITRGLQVLIERLVGFVQQMDITYLAPFITNLEPSLLWVNMGMGHLQPGDLTHPAARPVAQSEESARGEGSGTGGSSMPRVGLRWSNPFSSIRNRAKLLMVDFTRA